MNLVVEFLIDSDALRTVPGYGWGCEAGDRCMVPFSIGVKLVAHDIAKLVNPTPAAEEAVATERQEVIRLRAAATLAESARAQRNFIQPGDNLLRGGTLENARRVAIAGMRGR
jgi:hypothetical protein